jgi:hypothetical protein
MRLKVSTTVWEPIERQIPPCWRSQGIEVFINRLVDRCDAWVVYQGLHRPDETIVPPERILFFSYEPPGLHEYQERFLAQFAKIVTCQQQIRHPKVIYRHQAQPWVSGIERYASENMHKKFGVRFSYDDFASMALPEKTRRLSAVCSRKMMVPGHQARLDFLEELRKAIGDALDIFGYGFQPVVDKWDALAPYQYHLALENSCVSDYWTEKVADAFLAWCVPIVWGCPNLNEYFPENSFVAIDPTDARASVEKIKEVIARPPSAGQRLAVTKARQLVLEEYNLFPEILRLAEATPCGEARRVRIRDERLFLPGGRIRPLVRAMTDRWRSRK